MAIASTITDVLSSTICWAIKHDRELRWYTFSYESGRKNTYEKEWKYYPQSRKKDIHVRIAEKRAEIALRESSNKVAIS